jgi:2-keto-4-pentenoate hydratase
VIGWKVGFGSPEALGRLGIDRPLVAPLPASGRLSDGAVVSLDGWANPLLEVEVAVWVGRGIGAAIELADLEFPPDDAERILASGIYHRHVLLGPVVDRPLAGVTARVFRDGEEVAATDDLTALTGTHEDVLAAVRAEAGRDLEEGEVVITGAVVPPLPVSPGEQWTAELGVLGRLSVSFRAT